MLITVLGELVYPGPGPVLTTTLLRVMRGVGVEDHAARQAISRSATAGWIRSERDGRSVRWHLAAHGREIVEDGMRRSTAFAAEAPPWDGQWLTLLVSVPENQRTVRKQLYGGLSWLGLGYPTPGLWVSPHVDICGEVADLVDRFGLRSSAMGFVGSIADIGMTDEEIVGAAWHLVDLAGRYEALLAQYSSFVPAPGDELLFAHLRLLNLLQRFMRLDPRLPKELLPEWVGRAAAELFRERRREWSGPARVRWLAMVDEGAAG